MTKRMSPAAKPSKALPAVVGMLGLVVLLSPAWAQQGATQSMFQQMPTAPSDAAQPAQPGSAPAQPAAAAAPSMSMGMGTPAPSVLGGPAARSVSGQGNVDCGAIQHTLAERKSLVAKANAAAGAKNKMTPAQACSLFGKLYSNGVTGLKWIAANKDWCSIPESFASGFKTDNEKVGGIKSKVCTMAAQVTKMEAQAREGGGGGLLGGPGLTGTFKMPQGAL